MTPRRAALALALIALPAATWAHDVALVPSACVCDPVRLASTDGGVVAAVAPATTADVLRMVYDAAAPAAQLQGPVAPPRALTVDGVAGSLRFPVAAPASITTAGDVVFGGPAAPTAWFEVAMGGARAAVAVGLTTGAVPLPDGSVATGVPIGRDGAFRLVGRVAAGVLPGPLAAHESLLDMGCRLDPAPDVDQLSPAVLFEQVRGRLEAEGGRIEGRLVAPEPRGIGGPVVVALSAGSAPVAHVVLADGLAQRGRRASASAVGGTLQLRRLGRPADGRWRFSLRLDGPIDVPAGDSMRLALVVAFGDTNIGRTESEALGRRGRFVVR